MSIIVKFNSRIQIKSHDEDKFVFIIDGNRTATFYTQIYGLHSVLIEFEKKGKSLDELARFDEKDKRSVRLFQFVEMLKKSNFVDYHFCFADSGHAIISPVFPRFKEIDLKKTKITWKKGIYTLSRFTYFRRDQNKIALENFLSSFRVYLSNQFLIKFLPFINGEIELIEFISAFAECDKELILFINILIENYIIQPIQDCEKEHLNSWEFHDLLFHSCSRSGQSDDNVRFGATYRFRNTMVEPPQTFKEIDLSKAIELYTPDMNELSAKDIPFSKVLENRRSMRKFNKDQVINIKNLGEFLYRSVGIRKVVQSTMQDAIFRPYPGAGAIHEIEFYLVAFACDGLSQDVYYYQPLKHVLCKLEIDRDFINKSLLNANRGMGLDANAAYPQILFILTSRFQKIAWKYEKIAYRSTLISLGTVFQTMSLVATSMGLASCIVSTGNPTLFSEATGINPLLEGSVGEFALGIPDVSDRCKVHC